MAEFKPEMQLQQNLQLKQQLKLIQSPIMIQRMELLQAPLLEVVRKLKQELEENPVLMLVEPAKIEETGFTEDFDQKVSNDTPDNRLSKDSDLEQNEFKNRDEFENELTFQDFVKAEEFVPKKSTVGQEDKKLEAMKNTASAGPTLQDYLYEQLLLQDLEEYQILIGEQIIYNLDNNGYLRYHLLEIVNQLPRNLNLPEKAYEFADARISEVLNDLEYKLKLNTSLQQPSQETNQNTLESGKLIEETNESSDAKKKKKSRRMKKVEAEAESSLWANRAIPFETNNVPDELLYSSDKYLWALFYEGEKVLNLIQKFEPAGVANYSLKECLIQQLTPDLPEYQLANEILENYFDDFLHQQYEKISEKISVSTNNVIEAANSIASLNPRPGNLFAGRDVPYILPDISIKDVEGEYYAIMEDKYLPGVTISPAYLQLVYPNAKNISYKTKSQPDSADTKEFRINDDDDEELLKMLTQETFTPEVKSFVKDKVQSAKTLLDALEQRQITLEKVAQVIINRQKEFFKKGIEGLKPLKMQEVADKLGLHVSTISRAVSDKYIDTPQGIYALRYFFRSGTVNDIGEEQSVEIIKATLKELIVNEDTAKPLSDDVLGKMIADKHKIKIARRTIAKYRTLLDIPSSHKRKK